MAERIRLLIVDDDDGMREAVARLLEIEFGDHLDIVGFAENGAVAIERVRELSPDVVLMDVNMPVMNGIEATAQITEIAPQTGVIMLTVQDDSLYVKRAFQARAFDFVTKPVNPSELTGAITRFMAGREVAAPATPTTGLPLPPPPPAASGHVIGVVGFKGGTGKTTLAVNLAIGLAKGRKRVALVDSDVLFGDVSITLNTRGQRSIINLASAAEDPDQMEPDLIDVAMITHDSGAKLLLAPANPGDSAPVSITAMTNMLDFLRRHFEYVIVDTSRNMDEILLAVVRGSDRLIVVTTASMAALKDTRFMFNELSSLDAMNKVILALNMVERSNPINPEQIANHLHVPIAVQIPFDLTAMSALNSGVPLITLDPKRAPSVKPLIDMARLVVKACERSEEPA